jgi:hypothetical protein
MLTVTMPILQLFRQQQERQLGSRLNDVEEKLTTTSRSLHDTVNILAGRLNTDLQVQMIALFCTKSWNLGVILELQSCSIDGIDW